MPISSTTLLRCPGVEPACLRSPACIAGSPPPLIGPPPLRATAGGSDLVGARPHRALGQHLKALYLLRRARANSAGIRQRHRYEPMVRSAGPSPREHRHPATHAAGHRRATGAAGRCAAGSPARESGRDRGQTTMPVTVRCPRAFRVFTSSRAIRGTGTTAPKRRQRRWAAAATGRTSARTSAAAALGWLVRHLPLGPSLGRILSPPYTGRGWPMTRAVADC
jgi:hypothetical protein